VKGALRAREPEAGGGGTARRVRGQSRRHRRPAAANDLRHRVPAARHARNRHVGARLRPRSSARRRQCRADGHPLRLRPSWVRGSAARPGVSTRVGRKKRLADRHRRRLDRNLAVDAVRCGVAVRPGGASHACRGFPRWRRTVTVTAPPAPLPDRTPIAGQLADPPSGLALDFLPSATACVVFCPDRPRWCCSSGHHLVGGHSGLAQVWRRFGSPDTVAPTRRGPADDAGSRERLTVLVTLRTVRAGNRGQPPHRCRHSRRSHRARDSRGHCRRSYGRDMF